MKKITMNLFVISVFVATYKIICVTSNRCTKWSEWSECINGIISRTCISDPSTKDSISCKQCGHWVDWTSCFEGKTSRYLSNCPYIVDEKDCVSDIKVNTLNSINNLNIENENYYNHINSSNSLKNYHIQDKKKAKSLKFLEGNITEAKYSGLNTDLGNLKDLKGNNNKNYKLDTNFNQLKKIDPIISPSLSLNATIPNSSNDNSENLVFKDENYKFVSEGDSKKIDEKYKIKKHEDISDEDYSDNHEFDINDDDEIMYEDVIHDTITPNKSNTLLKNEEILDNSDNTNKTDEIDEDVDELDVNGTILPTERSTNSTDNDTDAAGKNTVIHKVDDENGELKVHEKLRVQKQDKSTNTYNSPKNNKESIYIFPFYVWTKISCFFANNTFYVVSVIFFLFIFVFFYVLYNPNNEKKEKDDEAKIYEKNSEIIFNDRSKIKNIKEKCEEEFWVLE